MYSLSFYVPESHLDEVKEALFAKGAGRYNKYAECSWQTKGKGQFMPLADSQPFIGSQGPLETVEEYRVEMVCADDLIAEAVATLRLVHPYEEPAFQVIKLEEFSQKVPGT